MSYIDFDERVDHEIVVLSHSPENTKHYFSYGYEYFSSWAKIRKRRKRRKRKNKRRNKKKSRKRNI